MELVAKPGAKVSPLGGEGRKLNVAILIGACSKRGLAPLC